MVCDICNAPGRGTIVSSQEMKTIVRNGFTPRKAGLASATDAIIGILGTITPQQVDDNWRQQVLGDSTDWNLCADCYSKTRSYAPHSQMGTQTDKKWWEFWK